MIITISSMWRILAIIIGLDFCAAAMQAALAQGFPPELGIENVALVEIWNTQTLEHKPVGSGVAIDLDGNILTAKHVLRDLKEPTEKIYVRFNSRNDTPIEVGSHKCADGDPDKDGPDVCVLKIADSDLRSAAKVNSVQPIRCRKLNRDEEVVGRGWPADSRFNWDKANGKISSTLTVIGYPTDARALPGMSGGPFYDGKHNIVGLIKGEVGDGARTLLTPLFSAKGLIDATGTPCGFDPNLPAPPSVPPEVVWGNQIGGGGGDPFETSCSPREALVGLFGKASSGSDARIFSVGPICALISSDSPQTSVWPTAVRMETPHHGDYVGTNQGDDYEVRCQAPYMVVGLDLQYVSGSGFSPYITRPLSLKCLDKTASTTPILKVAPGPQGLNFATHQPSTCGEGAAGAAIKGRAGQWIDALGIGCREIKP